MITDTQWETFEATGFLRLGKILDANDLTALGRRIDDIMLGTAHVDYDRMLMQLDSATGRYGDAGAMSKGHKGATLAYRKIQDLELDPLFLAFLQRPLFEDICRRAYGNAAAVSCFRAMFMNKPAKRGTVLPWHQDRWTYLDADPKITVWTALDPATRENGCVQIVPGSHKKGLINPSHLSGFLTDEQASLHATKNNIEYLELPAGEAVLLHNYLLHSSDINGTDIPRRAFSVCYMDARTRADNGERFNTVFGPGALRPDALAARL